MPATNRNFRPRRPRRLASLATAVLAAALALGLVTSAGAERAKTLGKTKRAPAPNCSGKSPSECQITGKVTGFQRSADGRKNLFRVRQPSRIVAWSVDLARPSKEERQIFGEAAKNNNFGTAPTAGIGILRKDGKQRFKLIRSSPILKVNRHYGTKPIFTLQQPLMARKGDVVALTTATWLPAFSVKGQGPNDRWVASRTKKQCEIPPSVPANERLEWFFSNTRPHRKQGSTRNYKCTYSGARLLYWAYYTPIN